MSESFSESLLYAFFAAAYAVFHPIERRYSKRCELDGKNWTVFGGWLREGFAPKMA